MLFNVLMSQMNIYYKYTLTIDRYAKSGGRGKESIFIKLTLSACELVNANKFIHIIAI